MMATTKMRRTTTRRKTTRRRTRTTGRLVGQSVTDGLIDGFRRDKEEEDKED